MCRIIHRCRTVFLLLLTLSSTVAVADHLPPQSVMRLGAAEHGTGIFTSSINLAQVYHQDSIDSRRVASHEHNFGVAMSSAGSIGNLRDLAAGRIEFGFVHANLANLALRSPQALGLDQSVSRLRLVAAMQPSMVQIIARRTLGDGTINSLRGKRVSFGMTDTGQFASANTIFDAHGIAKEDLKRFHYPLTLAAQKLKSRKLDAIVLVDQSPSPLVRQLLQNQEYHLLRLDRGVVETLINGKNQLALHLVEKNPYDSTDNQFTTVSVDTYLLSQDTVPPASVMPILMHLKKQNNLRKNGLPSSASLQEFRVKSLESLMPMHDACISIDVQERVIDTATILNTPDTVEAEMNASADH